MRVSSGLLSMAFLFTASGSSLNNMSGEMIYARG